MSGIKHDEGKPRMSLLPKVALIEVAKVLTFGAKKYEPWNWTKGFVWSRLYDAAERHIAAHQMGTDKDEETKLSHLAHAICCLLFLLTFELLGLGEDDRHKFEKEEAETEGGGGFEVGDPVVVTGDESFGPYGIPAGTSGIVREISRVDGIHSVEVDGGRRWICEKDMKHKKPSQLSDIKPGAHFRVIKEEHGHNFPIGSIVKIVRVFGPEDFLATDGTHSWSLAPSEVERLEPSDETR